MQLLTALAVCCCSACTPCRCKQAEVHSLPPPGATCALCHAGEAPAAHLDQAHALRSCGLSCHSLGPLMPVTLSPLRPSASGSRADSQQQPTNAAAGTGGGAPDQLAVLADAAAAAADAADNNDGADKPPQPPAAPAAPCAPESAVAEASEVVWVHRQCALWSPEVYPDRAGILVRSP
jgi:hypothetical protein